MTDYDVAIIGAGPAGTSCALSLKDSGLKVVLADQYEFPRDKICGDAIPGPAFRVMDRIDPEWGREMRKFTESARIRSSEGITPAGHRIRFDWKTFSYNSKRVDFDGWLYELVRTRTSIHWLAGFRLTEVRRKGTTFHCFAKNGEHFSARFLVGCDGAHSTVARTLLPRSHADRKVGGAVRRYYRDVRGVRPEVNEFHFLRDHPLGYFWIFPVANGYANVGFGTLSDGNKPTNLRHDFENIIAAHPTLSPRFREAQALDKIRGFALPYCSRPRQLSGDGFLLCGDAASLVSPLWGHGIDTAMKSGNIAAGHIIKAFASDNSSIAATVGYDEEIQQKIGRDFQRSFRMLRLFQRFPFLLRGVWTTLYFHRPLRWILKRMGWL